MLRHMEQSPFIHLQVSDSPADVKDSFTPT